MFIDAQRDFYHFVGPTLGQGSVIKAGNWGRIIRAVGWWHSEAYREHILELSRQQRNADAPSRLSCAFCFPSVQSARQYQQFNQQYSLHVLMRVKLLNPERGAFLANYIDFKPSSADDQRWPDKYWVRNGAEAEGDFLHPEVLTTSDLIVDEVVE